MKIKEFYQLYYPNNIIFNNHSINKITDDSREVEEHYIFPIGQKFIMDKERNIHIYNE